VVRVKGWHLLICEGVILTAHGGKAMVGGGADPPEYPTTLLLGRKAQYLLVHEGLDLTQGSCIHGQGGNPIRIWLFTWSHCSGGKTVAGDVTPLTIDFNMSDVRNQGDHE